VWQWVRNEVVLDTGAKVTADLVRSVLASTRDALRDEVPAEFLDPACLLFEEVALASDYVDFLTLPAYERIE
jgi:malate synthase